MERSGATRKATKRNEMEWNEAKPNGTKPKETKRNIAKPKEAKRNVTKRNQSNRNITRETKMHQPHVKLFCRSYLEGTQVRIPTSKSHRFVSSVSEPECQQPQSVLRGKKKSYHVILCHGLKIKSKSIRNKKTEAKRSKYIYIYIKKGNPPHPQYVTKGTKCHWLQRDMMPCDVIMCMPCSVVIYIGLP